MGVGDMARGLGVPSSFIGEPLRDVFRDSAGAVGKALVLEGDIPFITTS